MVSDLFTSVFDSTSWDEVKFSIYSKSEAEVKSALQKPKLNLQDFSALLSPAAAPFLEQMAQRSQEITQRRFGKTIQLFAPLYLSNECQNICTYCGFSLDNKIKRKTLSNQELIEEIEYLKKSGFEHVLLVTGEANQTVGVSYLKNAIGIAAKYFAQVSIEVQPLEINDYLELKAAGLYSVLVYQETYHKEDYKKHHPKGKKSNFNYRLETPDRIGAAFIHKIGLGTLIGLEDWRTDALFTAMHLQYLEKKYWKTRYSISFPRLRPAEGIINPKVEMNDKELVQLICAYRIFNEEVELSLSTREHELFRNHVFKLGITSMSAGSKTNPGGYTLASDSLEQFEISDERSADEIALLIRNNGYEAVWKDWDAHLSLAEMQKT